MWIEIKEESGQKERKRVDRRKEKEWVEEKEDNVQKEKKM